LEDTKVYIPPDAKWYIAKVVEEITVEGDPRNVVHTNFLLIRADSPEEAYDKAFVLGKDDEDNYQNPSGKTVRVRFCGLSGLNVVHGDLEHGTELLYEENIGIPTEKVEEKILSKDQLAVFRSFGPRKVPDYSSAEVVDAASRLANNSAE
jgi:hypothetical protein